MEAMTPPNRKPIDSVDESKRGPTLPIRRPKGPETNQKLPEIMVTERHMRDIVADAWRVVDEVNDPVWLFQRGRLMTDIVFDDSGSPVVRPMNAKMVKGLLDRTANFVKEDNEGKHPARPPQDVVGDMMSSAEFPLPVLRGIADTPVFAPSGTVVSESGYDAETGLYLYLRKIPKISAVPERPSREEIDQARSWLIDELLGDFPFVEQADLAHAVAIVLLPFVRLMIDGPTPLHMIESPTPGTGKSLLAETVCLPGLGKGPSIMTEGRDEDEWRKRLTAKLLLAPQVILLDNVKNRLDSAALSAALTAPVWEDRVLGESRTVSLPVTCIWIATSNNPGLSLEVARRIVSIRIDAKMELPSVRQGFRHPKLGQWAGQNRGKLIWAALTLGQAWIAAGAPDGKEVMGSYDAYAEVMGGILQVADIPGFLTNRDRVYDEVDQEVAVWSEFCAAWWDEYKDRKVRVKQLLQLAYEYGLLTDQPGIRDENGGRTKLGLALSKARDRVVGGFRIRVGFDSRAKSATYYLEAL